MPTIYRRIYRYCINFCFSGRQNAFLFTLCVCLLSFCRFNFLSALLVVMLLASFRLHNSFECCTDRSPIELCDARARTTAAYIPFWKRGQTKKEEINRNKYTEEQISCTHKHTIFVFFSFARLQHPIIIINIYCRWTGVAQGTELCCIFDLDNIFNVKWNGNWQCDKYRRESVLSNVRVAQCACVCGLSFSELRSRSGEKLSWRGETRFRWSQTRVHNTRNNNNRRQRKKILRPYVVYGLRMAIFFSTTHSSRYQTL